MIAAAPSAPSSASSGCAISSRVIRAAMIATMPITMGAMPAMRNTTLRDEVARAQSRRRVWILALVVTVPFASFAAFSSLLGFLGR